MRPGIDHIGVGVGAMIVDDTGRLFLARRGSKAKNERGLWEFPGGSVEFGERLKEALQREMREEYGIEICVGELLDVVDHILPDESQHWVSPAFICTITSGEPKIREAGKCTEVGWFAPDEAPADLTQITRANLAHYMQYLRDRRSVTDRVVVLLDEMQRLRDEIVSELASLTEEELCAQTQAVPWRIQHILYRFAAHEEEHINQIIAGRWAVGAMPTVAQLILAQFLGVRGRLEGALVSLSDEQAAQPPRTGEWSILEILRHVLESDRQYLAWIRHNRDRTK